MGQPERSEDDASVAVLRIPIEMTWDDAGSPGVNVWHARSNESGIDTSLDAVMDALHDFYFAIQPILRQDLDIRVGEVVDVDSGQGYAPAFAPIIGPGTVGFAPPVAQVVISWRTSLRARRGMGRTFIGPLQNGTLESNGTVATASMTVLTNATSALLDASTGAGVLNEWALGVYGQEDATPGASPEIRRAEPKLLRDFTDYRIKDRISVLRSRRD